MRAALAAFCLLLCGCGAAVPREAAEPVLRIYLARHGQTDWNAEGRLQGGTDVPLNQQGREQAAALARTLEGVPLDRIYTSALSRSRETGAALAARAPVESLAGLNEQSIGAFEGKHFDRSDPASLDEFRRRSANPDDLLDGGESASQHFARVSAAVRSILERHPSGTVLIVGHGGTNSLILRELLKLDAAAAGAIHQANDELYLIERRGARAPAIFKLVPLDRLSEL